MNEPIDKVTNPLVTQMFTVLCFQKIEGESNQFISWCVIKWCLMINHYVIFTFNSKNNSKSVLFGKSQIFLFYIYFIFFSKIPFSQNVIDTTIEILFWSQIVWAWILALPITRCVILCKNCVLHFTPLCLTFWRRQWRPTLVFLPGKSHGWRSLVGCSPWGREELDTT